MWVPFAILAVASIAVGLIGFAFEHQLHEMFTLILLVRLVLIPNYQKLMKF
jgi:NADH-quinone oxidoreductase subunit L